MAWWLRRYGVLPRSATRALWIHGEAPAEFEAAEPLLAALRAAFPRLVLRFLAPGSETLRWLEARHPVDAVLPTPRDARLVVRRYYRNARPRALLLLGGVGSFPLRGFEGLQRRSIGIAVVNGRLDAALLERARFIDRFCMIRADDRDALAAAGVASEDAIHVDGSAPDRGVSRSLELIRPLVQRDLRRARASRRGARPASAPGAVAVRIGSIEELRIRLSEPRSILCLGNGPSSEDPKLREGRWDALFRVNWRWLERGFLTRPDMVFTGDRRTLERVGPCLYGFRTMEEEERILASELPAPGIESFSCERAGSFLTERDWGARPTNGAAMLATAVALQPRRLVIAGIDLFADPEGSYPGRSEVPNAYAPVHDREVELAIVREALARYRGEVEIIGAVLRGRLGMA